MTAEHLEYNLQIWSLQSLQYRKFTLVLADIKFLSLKIDYVSA